MLTPWTNSLDAALIWRGTFILLHLAGTFLIFVIGRWLLHKIIRRVFRPMIQREQASNPPRAARLITLETVAQSIMLYALYFIVLGLLMASVGLNPLSLVATAGVAGVAIGFGAQKLVRDVITGFLLLLEDQFSVGDLVTIGGNTGVVVETGMRITKLRDEAGRLIILSNGDIAQVINFSKGEFRIGIDLAVSSNADPQAVAEVVQAAGSLLVERNSRVKHPVVRGVTSMSASSTTYRIEATAPPSERTDAEADLRAALRAALTQREIPLA
ncbi:MAG: mechanosensitive ion channel family protein [Armatimonadetes bacterium]|nr:mechanosensitive ion channel family protein [Armatimonadota bacterium]